MAGRRPKPTAIKKLTGNPGKRTLNPDEPMPTSGIPDCPAHLTEMAKAEWARIVPELEAMGVLDKAGRSTLAIYVSAWARWVDAEEKIQRIGEIIKAPSGYPITNPLRSVANRAEDHMLKAAIEFGMTPSSRSRVHVSPDAKPKEKVSPLKTFLNKKVAKKAASVQ